MKNKKAQLGTIVSTFPVVIMVFLIMILFILLAGFISLKSGPPTDNVAVSYIKYDDFLLRESVFKIGDKLERKMIIDKLVELERNDRLFAGDGDLRTSLYELMIKEKINTCLLLYKDDYSQDHLIYECQVVKDESQDKESILVNGQKNTCKGFTADYGQTQELKKFYSKVMKEASFSVDKDRGLEEINLFYYYGKCLHNEVNNE